MPELKAGARLKSAVCTTEVIVVKTPPGNVDVRCGGVPMVTAAETVEPGTPKPDAALAVMQIDVATLIANEQPLGLFGDNLFLDLDLSTANLPTGSIVRLGAAVAQVTPEPHNGCRKFQARFGNDALRFVCRPETRHRNLRGIYMRVLEPGEVAVGDAVTVLSRA